MKLDLKVDTSEFTKFANNLKSTEIDVGWLKREVHWTNKITVPELAAHLHFDSAWKGEFMFDDTPEFKRQINPIIGWATKYLSPDTTTFKMRVGEELVDRLKENIDEVSSPSNNELWAEKKGFNDPLIFGSYYGYEPNLISSISYEVRK